MIVTQNPVPQDSQDGYLGIKLRIRGCKLAATKNEGIAEQACHNARMLAQNTFLEACPVKQDAKVKPASVPKAETVKW